MNKTSFIISILLIISLSFNVHQCNRKKEKEYANIEKEVIVEKTDTIIDYIYKTDTIYNTKKDTEYKYITVNDTTYIESKPEIFKDSTDKYDITINAVKLNNYQLNIHHTDTIFYEKEIIKNVYNKRKQHFNHGIQVGIGWGVWNRKPDLFIGYSVMYSF